MLRLNEASGKLLLKIYVAKGSSYGAKKHKLLVLQIGSRYAA
ncbi:hypothetical protein FHS10_002154 [Mucilaginibacter dorajii]|nr:hypothetical protein [Mucilaginibacter dorajii]